MKYLYTFCLLLLFSFSACDDEETSQACTLVNPAENLAWLKVRIPELQESEYCQVVQRAWWKGRVVYIISNCDPLVNSISPVYDCDGNLLCYGGDDSCPDFSSEVINQKTVWHNGK